MPTLIRRRTRPHAIDQSAAEAGACHGLIYRRVSSDDQEREGVSLDAQLAECQRYVAQRGWVVGGDYTDVLSGKRDDRPEYQRLLADIRRLRAGGTRVAVVVAALDRLGRRLGERVRCREEFGRLGVTTHAVREGGEVSDLVANVLAAVAEEEARRLGERVSKSWEYIRARGWHFVGRVPFGYRLRERTDAERVQGAPAKVLDVDPEAAEQVLRAFERVAAGEPTWAVMRDLAALPENVRGGRGMGSMPVRRLLASPTYVARPVADDEHATPEDVLAQPKGRWPALVPDDVWLAVQQRGAQRKRVPAQASGRYLLTGLLRCTCGHRMVARVQARTDVRGGAYGRYVCSARNLGAHANRPGCNASANMRALDDAVRAEVIAVLDPLAGLLPEMRPLLLDAWEALRRDPDEAERAREIARQEAKRDQAKRRLAEATLKLLDRALTKEAYDLVSEQITSDLREAEAALTRILRETPSGARLPDLDDVLARAGSWGRLLREGPIAAQRDVLAALIDRVEPVRLGRGRYDAEIDWTPDGKALRGLVAGLPPADVS